MEQARLRAVASEHASDWLSAVPVANLGMKLDNSSLWVAVGLRLGTKICESHKCVCGQLVDPCGRHGLSCRNAKGTHSRHSQANDIKKGPCLMWSTCCAIAPWRSVGKCPDGLTLYPWSNGKNVVWDFTCRDTLSPSHVISTTKEAGKASEQAETTKMSTYNNLMQLCLCIILVAMETLGSWGLTRTKFISEIGTRIAESTGEKRSRYFLFQALSMATQRGNVASILGTAPNVKKMDEIFYL